MQLNYFKTLFFFFAIALFSACTSTTTTVVVTSDATFSSLTLVNSKIVKLNTVTFTTVGDTIVNLDSLPVGTKVDKLIPVFAFVSSSQTHLIKSKTDSVLLNKTDSVDFTNLCIIRNYASDQVTSKAYFVKVNVHKVDPEKYIWSKLLENLNVQNAVSQKAILLNNKIFYFLNDGTASYVQTSVDGVIWDGRLAVNGLPNDAHLENMTEFNGKLYLALNENKLYSTLNGQDWVTEYLSVDYTYKSILFSFNNNLWVVAQSSSDSKYHVGTINNTNTAKLLIKGSLPAVNFPVSDFTSLSYVNRTGISKAILLGGKDADGNVLKTNWNTEGVDWVFFSRDSRSLETLSLVGTSVIAYDNKLLLFGEGINTKDSANYLVSKDEGFSWNLPDSSYNYLPKEKLSTGYKSRSYQSVLVLNPKLFKDMKTESKESLNNIFIIGGKSGSTFLPEVWKGKLNRLNFKRQ